MLHIVINNEMEGSDQRKDVGESEREEKRGNEEAEVYQGGREGGEEEKKTRDTRVGGTRRGHLKCVEEESVQ